MAHFDVLHRETRKHAELQVDRLRMTPSASPIPSSALLSFASAFGSSANGSYLSSGATIATGASADGQGKSKGDVLCCEGRFTRRSHISSIHSFFVVVPPPYTLH